MLVFEGNIPADPARNTALARLVKTGAPPERPRAAAMWLGEAIAIKDATAVSFRRQSGSNLLILGQDEEGALGISCMGLIGLAAQYPRQPGSPGVGLWIIDGLLDDTPHFGLFQAIQKHLPPGNRIAAWSDVGDLIADLADEVDKRSQGQSESAIDHYLFVHGMQRFRDLRKSDDDFGMSRDEKPSTAKRFGTIVRDGPMVGVHVIVWCDNLNNLNRTLERQTLREFEMKVLFQMSGNDSSTLIDSPAAAKLGLHRALYFAEEQGKSEKFRPYGIPEPEWLRSLGAT